jgi:hypothetical protein
LAWGAPLIRCSNDGAIVLAARPIASLLAGLSPARTAASFAALIRSPRWRAPGLRWARAVERLGGFEVGCCTGRSAGLSPLEDAAGVDTGQTIRILSTAAAAHEAPAAANERAWRIGAPRCGAPGRRAVRPG